MRKSGRNTEGSEAAPVGATAPLPPLLGVALAFGSLHPPDYHRSPLRG